MEDWSQDTDVLKELATRVAALEDNLTFLELWCEEQQDSLDRLGEPCWFLDDQRYEPESAHLHVVDLTDDAEDDGDAEYDRRMRQIRARLDALRHGTAGGPQ